MGETRSQLLQELSAPRETERASNQGKQGAGGGDLCWEGRAGWGRRGWHSTLESGRDSLGLCHLSRFLGGDGREFALGENLTPGSLHLSSA